MVKNVYSDVHIYFRRFILLNSNLKRFNKLFNVPVLLPHVLRAVPDNIVDKIFEIAELDRGIFRGELSDGELVEFGLSVSVLIVLYFFLLFFIVEIFVALDVVDGFAVLFHDVDELRGFGVAFGDGGKVLVDEPEAGLLDFFLLNLKVDFLFNLFICFFLFEDLLFLNDQIFEREDLEIYLLFICLVVVFFLSRQLFY